MGRKEDGFIVMGWALEEVAVLQQGVFAEFCWSDIAHAISTCA
jgi:hypothetical protein